jgi:hypothetical protein
VSGPGFFDTLEAQLGDGLDRVVQQRATRRRRLERAAGAAVVVVAVLVAGLVLTRDDRAGAGVVVEQRGGLVYVRLVDLEHDAGAIERAADDAGIDVEVEEVPVGPSLVGRFLNAFRDDPVGELRELDRDGPAFSGFAIPAGFDGTLILRVGRPAHGREAYIQATNAVSEGEPLACSGIIGASPARAAELLDARDLDARWFEQAERGQLAVDAVTADAGARVVRVFAGSPTQMVVLLADPGVEVPPLELTAPATC